MNTNQMTLRHRFVYMEQSPTLAFTNTDSMPVCNVIERDVLKDNDFGYVIAYPDTEIGIEAIYFLDNDISKVEKWIQFVENRVIDPKTISMHMQACNHYYNRTAMTAKKPLSNFLYSLGCQERIITMMYFSDVDMEFRDIYIKWHATTKKPIDKIFNYMKRNFDGGINFSTNGDRFFTNELDETCFWADLDGAM